MDDSSFFGFPIIFESESDRKKCIDLFKREDVECRPIVAGNFTKNKVIDYFDYSIYGNLENANILHERGLFIGNHHYDIKDKLDEIYNLIKDEFNY